jgi:ABC-2 type transport system permease protein
MPSFSSRLKREQQLYAADRWLASLVSWLPPLLFFMVWCIFSGGVARDLATAVVDLDGSRTSRNLIRQYDASPTLKVEKVFKTEAEGMRALRGGEIFLLVILPAELEKESVLGHAPQATAFYNSQFILIGRLVNSALQQAHATAVAAGDIGRILFGGTTAIEEAKAVAAPLGYQVIPLFNAALDYSQFLVSAIVPAIWQILIVSATILSLAAEKRRQGLRSWASPFPAGALFLKMLPMTLAFWGHGLIFLLGMFSVLGWPMHGSWLVLVIAQLLTVVACQCAGVMIFMLSLDATRALSLAAAYAAPGFAFAGITFPVSDMNLPARIWRSIMPISHYIDIQVGQANYGQPFAAAVQPFAWLLMFLLLAPVIVGRLQSITAADSAEEGGR